MKISATIKKNTNVAPKITKNVEKKVEEIEEPKKRVRTPIHLSKDKIERIKNLREQFDREYDEFIKAYDHFLYEPKKKQLTPFAIKCLDFKKLWGEMRNEFKEMRNDNIKVKE